jgi:hypothetical protein
MSYFDDWKSSWFTMGDVYKSYYAKEGPAPLSERYDWFTDASHGDPAVITKTSPLSSRPSHGDPAGAMGMSVGTPAPSDFWKKVTEAHRQIKEDFAKKEGVDSSIREQINSDLDRQIERSVKRE